MIVSEETMKQFGYLGRTAAPGAVSCQHSASAVTEHDHVYKLSPRCKLYLGLQSLKEAEQSLEARVKNENLIHTFNYETKTTCLLYSPFAVLYSLS